MKRLREGKRLKLQKTLSDDLDDDGLDKLLLDAGIPEDIVKDMSREEKRSNCTDILTSNAELKNQTANKENTDTEDKGQGPSFDEKQETKEKSKKANRKRKKQLSLHCKKDIQENEETTQPSDTKFESTSKDEEKDVAYPTETQPPERKMKRGKKSCQKGSASPKYDDVPLTDEDCDAAIQVLVPNTERSPTSQRSPTGLSDQVISESEMSSSPQESVKVTLNHQDLSKKKIGIVRFAPDGMMDPSVYTQVIELMFDIYIRRLRMARAKCCQKVREKWGDPVCCGLHSKHSLLKDPRQDEENNSEAGERTKRYATRSLSRNNAYTDFEMEALAMTDDIEDENWNVRSSRSKKHVESPSRNEEEIDFDIHSPASPVSHSKVIPYETVSDISSDNREDSDYNPGAKHQKKDKNHPKRQNKKIITANLRGKKKAPQKKKKKKERRELFTWDDDDDDIEVKEDTSSHLLSSKEPQQKVKESWDNVKCFDLHSENLSNKDSKYDEENTFETGGRSKRFTRGDHHRNSIGTVFEMETDARKVESKGVTWNFRSDRNKVDDGHSHTNEEEMDVENYSTAPHISDSKLKQYDSISDSSSENKDFDYEPRSKHKKKSKSLTKRPNQAEGSVILGHKTKATSQKEQTEELCTWNNDTIEKASLSQRSDSKEHQGKRNTMSRHLEKGETLHLVHPADEIKGISSGEDGAVWLSKEINPKHGKGYQDEDDSKTSGKKNLKETCELKSRRLGKKRKINAHMSWMGVDSLTNPDMPESENVNPCYGVLHIEEETFKHSSECLSGKSSKMIKSSTDESRYDIDGTSKGPPKSPVEVISLPEDTLDPGTVIDSIPNSQSSGYLLDSNGDMYCTQINKDFIKHHPSRRKENIQMKTVTKDVTALCETQVLNTKKGGGQKGKKMKKITKVGKDKILGGRTLLSKDSPKMKRKKQTKLDRFADDTLQVSKQDKPHQQEHVEISSSESSSEAVVLENSKREKRTRGDGGYSTLETSSIQKSLPHTSKKELTEDDTLTGHVKFGNSSKAEKDVSEEADTLEDSDDIDKVLSPEKGTCPICGKEFSTKDLQYHASSCSDFAEEQETKAQCMICQKEFDLDLLKRHQASCIDIHGEYGTRQRGKARGEGSVAPRRSKRNVVEMEGFPVSSGSDYGELYIEPEHSK